MPASTDSVSHRLLPLQVAYFLQGVMLWLPVEKLFMTEIGFDAASIGVMAAAYAAVVPLIEFPSGILADRWSRRGVLIISSVALAATALIGGLSSGVALYVVSALVLGIYFAMYSGTMDAAVYDTVLEETGVSDTFEKHLGRIRMINSIALVSSSLAGGVLAALTSTRTTYFTTVPIALLSVAALLYFDEPRLHRAASAGSLKAHVAVTIRTITRRRALLPILALALLTAVVSNVLFEFGPLWLAALDASPALYGPLWAGLVSALGIGGLLAARLDLGRAEHAVPLVLVMITASIVPATVRSIAAVSVAQIVLAIGVIAASIHVTRLLHDSVSSTVRTGVASGVSTLSWATFLPLALLFGVVSRDHGVFTAGWLIVVIVVAAGALLITATRRTVRTPAAADSESESTLVVA
ncbi:MFS transporter [Antrihabitans sp. YC2-6]|uniref:MFS transporter n=1 Tax=Antrihabitans sp. YC2-6 TaxID=2799498 RepID=UPI0018F3311F|nr:MFS transporter [Antrihabitans sp. YC2-6]MBJ8344163.1 MFS transporter [Antrihabitans sp. YC2-6]